MAPKTEKARRENAQVAEFIEKLYGIGGFSSWGEFGREAGGVPAATVSDWKRGENAPSGYNLLRLIWAAERRHKDSPVVAAFMTDPIIGAAVRIANELALTGTMPEAPGEDGQRPPVLDLHSRLQALEAKVVESADTTAESLEALQRGIARIEERLPDEGDQGRKAVTR